MPLDKPIPSRKDLHKGLTPGIRRASKEYLRSQQKLSEIGQNPVYRGFVRNSRAVIEWQNTERKWEKDHPLHNYSKQEVISGTARVIEE